MSDELPDVSRRKKLALAMIGVSVAARIARDRRTYERVIVLAIVLAAAGHAARSSQAHWIERLIAWDKRVLNEQRRAKASRS